MKQKHYPRTSSKKGVSREKQITVSAGAQGFPGEDPRPSQESGPGPGETVAPATPAPYPRIPAEKMIRNPLIQVQLPKKAIPHTNSESMGK